ncbi:alpha/beta hydrolase [Vagococcus elongatus]|uniref:Serine aminopeptidase S33 domain-containing protein n=1 Tax=Vagococcus elongatus TaxID=180344 RepID=A0A430AXC2_9ENTE|nr:alpha/beta hydrolase [Vagococcus elongatus]RSU12695.1 hypothetical protein CBF29_06085 [Vagococcus elongatus]
MKRIWYISGTVGVLMLGAVGWGVDYLYRYAIATGKKDFISQSEATGSGGAAFDHWTFAEQAPETLSLEARDGLKLKGTYFQHKEQHKKLAVIAHGYGSDSTYMKEYAKMIFEMGWDIFLPDARGHGQSEGNYIGFGWDERLDLIDWTSQLVKRYSKDVDVMLFGVSMGASTVMMGSGEKLPEQVKIIVEDCGYTSVKNELSYQLKEMFHLPSFPLIPLTSVYTDLKTGYNFYEADAVKQLKKNKLPTLFIHGTEDTFVPTEMVHSLYDAAQGPKELWLVEGAGHAESLKKAPENYEKQLGNFISRYLK